jgi:hypothetical protein
MFKTNYIQDTKINQTDADTISDSGQEVADIFRLYGDEYIKNHPQPAHYLKVIHNIKVCRTEYLGGHIYKCTYCGYEKEVYNSCRNRHCPKCQFTARLKWVQKRKSEILPIGYFHDVFTLPHELNPLVLRNKTICLNLLFKSTSETLLSFGINNLTGKIGFIAVLHTWSQTLHDHFHLHCVIPSIALSKAKDSIIRSREDYLFNVKNLSSVFRGKYIDHLKRAYENNELKFAGKIEYLSDQNAFNNFVNRLWEKQWVVYSKKPFSDPETVLEYLSRYTHRVAIANYRIVSVTDGSVTFKYKDRKNDNIEKEMTVTAGEFIRRFLLHVLPEKFMKIRYYGFLANRSRKENIRLCRKLLNVDYFESTCIAIDSEEKNSPDQSTDWLQVIEESIGIDITTCPQCMVGPMQLGGSILSEFEKSKYFNTS